MSGLVHSYKRFVNNNPKTRILGTQSSSLSIHIRTSFWDDFWTIHPIKGSQQRFLSISLDISYFFCNPDICCKNQYIGATHCFRIAIGHFQTIPYLDTSNHKTVPRLALIISETRYDSTVILFGLTMVAK